MSTINYQSPSAFLFLHYKISVKDSNVMINDWLAAHPQESRATLSKQLQSKKVIVKNNKIFDLPRLSLNEATTLLQEIQASKAIEVKDRRYQLKNYPQCFVGSELVDYLTQAKNITTAEAIALGQSLLEHNLIQHVLDEHEFKNDFLFYRFRSEQPRLSASDAQLLLQEIQQSNAVVVKDRRHQLKSYPQCFIGSELVDYLTQAKKITSQEAIALGQSLLEHNLIEHVLNQHEFKNEFLYYRFK